MNFRASFGHDLTSTLEASYHEMPIDRLAAFSRAGRLGTCLWRLRWGFDASVYNRTIVLLKSECGLTGEVGRKLCEMVLREWLNPHCEVCLGAKETIAGDRRILCPRCKGLGLKRYSDGARARFMDMNIAEWREAANLAKLVLRKLTRAERLVGAQMHYELER